MRTNPKVSLDITWLRDESLEDTVKLPPPEVFAQEIVEDLDVALEQSQQRLRRGGED